MNYFGKKAFLFYIFILKSQPISINRSNSKQDLINLPVPFLNYHAFWYLFGQDDTRDLATIIFNLAPGLLDLTFGEKLGKITQFIFHSDEFRFFMFMYTRQKMIGWLRRLFEEKEKIESVKDLVDR